MLLLVAVVVAAGGRGGGTTLQGTVKQTLSFDETHGSPVMLDVNKDYLAAVTSASVVRVFKVAGREAKPHAGPGTRVALGLMLIVCAT